MKDAQWHKEEKHILVWGLGTVILMLLLKDNLVNIKWYWMLLVIPIFIIGSFITSGAFNPEYN